MNEAAAVIVTAEERIRTFLKTHQLPVRAVPLAKQLGLKDIRVVRSVLRDMKTAGELVSCTVYAGGAQEEEYRATAAVVGMAINTHTKALRAVEAPRRADASALPSRLNLDTKPQAPAIAPPSLPRRKRATTAINAPRRERILAYARRVDRAITSSELLREFQEQGESSLQLTTICCALLDARSAGALVLVGRRGSSKVYATPEVAERLKSNPEGNNGESTAAERPIPVAEAAAPAAAPAVGAQERDQKSTLDEDLLQAKATIAALDEQLERALAFNRQVEPAPDVAVRSRLEIFFQTCDGNWYGLPWLLRVAGGSVPDTLECLAALQRANKLAYSEADRAPIWHPVEGCW